jgi:hypothetical protein
VLAAALELGLTHFGTSLDRVGLAGLSQWGDMFALPRDGRAPEYQIAVLLAYDWPILVAGALGTVVFGQRLLRRGAGALTSPQRFVLVWVVLAALTVGLSSQREAGQLLILLLPLALMAGLLSADLLPTLNWGVLGRWWPAAALILVLLASVGLIISQWSNVGVSGAERFYLVVALGGAATLLAAGYAFLGRDATAIGVVVVATVAFGFAAHSSLSLAGNDEAVEFAVDIRTVPRIEQFRESVGQFATSRGGPVLVDPALAQPLAWYLRDVPVTFGHLPSLTLTAAPGSLSPAGRDRCDRS